MQSNFFNISNVLLKVTLFFYTDRVFTNILQLMVKKE